MERALKSCQKMIHQKRSKVMPNRALDVRVKFVAKKDV